MQCQNMSTQRKWLLAKIKIIFQSRPCTHVEKLSTCHRFREFLRCGKCSDESALGRGNFLKSFLRALMHIKMTQLQQLGRNDVRLSN